MNKKIIPAIILVVVIAAYQAFPQYNFQRIMGGPLHERAQTIFSTYDNGYIINGATTSFGAGDVDALTVKTDAQGQILWSYTYGTVNYDNPEYAIQTFDNSIVCAGRTNVQTASTSAMIYKLDSAGNLVWSKVYGLNSNAGFVSILETSDHGYAAVGNIPTAILLVRTDVNGDTLFTRQYDDVASEYGANLVQLPDSGFLICGRQQTIVSGNLTADGVLLRTDAQGNMLWSKLYGDSLWEEFTSLRLTSDGGFIVTGSTVTFGAGSYDILLMKTDSAGNIQWTKTFGGANPDAAYDIHINPDDSYVMSGYTESLGYGHRGIDSSNVFLLKTDSIGDLQWMQVYGDGLQDEAFRSNKSNDGGYLVSGFTRNYLFTDSSQMFIIKTDSLGLTGCHEQSVQPVDTNITLPNQSLNIIQGSGIIQDTIILTRVNVTPANDDACLFSAALPLSKIDTESRVYPNPFTNQLEINTGYPDSKIIITDIPGHQLFYLSPSASVISINTESLNPGIYIVTILNSDFSLKREIIIKQ